MPLSDDESEGAGDKATGATRTGGGPPNRFSATPRDLLKSSLSFSMIVVLVVSASSPVIMPPYGTRSSSLSTSTVFRALLDSRSFIRTGGGVGSGSESDPSNNDCLRLRPALIFIRGVWLSNDSIGGIADLRGLPGGLLIKVGVGGTAVIEDLDR